MLLEAGYDVNTTGARGRIVLYLLAAYRFSDSEGHRLEAASLLLLKGVDVLVRNPGGKIALEILRSEDTTFAQLLGSQVHVRPATKANILV
jgi:hypothetical protein